MMIDLRSDTVTRPTPGMMEAMINAPVGDDVFCEDPTVNRLELQTAELFGMQAALYCPTGTMSNQIAINVHTQPGDEVICDSSAHVYQYEGGGIARNAGCQAKLLPGDRGRINADQVLNSINPDDVHKARTSLVCVENTANRGGGSCYDYNEIVRIKEVCEKNKLRFHLDGARLFNALIAKNESPKQYGEIFDSISVCLNKGLGCPIGSMLIGNKEFIKKARRVRKVFGGGMRQAGYMAACGIYALENHIERLVEDHRHAQQVSAILSKKEFTGKMLPVETNIIIFEVKPPFTPHQITSFLKEHDILVIPISSNQIRMVFHLDISHEMVSRIINVLNTKTSVPGMVKLA